MIKKIALLMVISCTLAKAQTNNTSYFLESFSVNINPITMVKGYLPLSVEVRLLKRLSLETGPALVTYPYWSYIARPEPIAIYTNPAGIISSGDVSYNFNLGWETALKFYFERDIWESKYFGIFHSFRRSSADLVNIGNGVEDIQNHAFYNRNHFGIRYGSRFFLEELFRAGERWVVDASLGASHATKRFQNYSQPSGDFEIVRTLYLHFGISIGLLTEGSIRK